jgi:uncharacterized membrane protein YkoI
MKNSAKVALTIALFSILGTGTFLKSVRAAQIQNLVETIKPASIKAIAQDYKITQIAESSNGDGDGETNDERQDQQESARLQSLAKITPQQAQESAEKAVGGQSKRVQLENEDGDVVYSVLIDKKDIKVDAGNGKVLYIENLEEPTSEMNEKNLPHSSIHFSEGAGGDGDGETNDDG